MYRLVDLGCRSLKNCNFPNLCNLLPAVCNLKEKYETTNSPFWHIHFGVTGNNGIPGEA